MYSEKEKKIPKNQTHHRWHNADEYEAEFGSLPTADDVFEEYREVKDEQEEMKSNFKEKYGTDLFTKDGKINEYWHVKPDEQESKQNKSLSDEFSDVKKEFSDFFKSIKNIFSKK